MGFVFVDVDNPDDELQPGKRRLGGRKSRKVSAFKRLLSAQGVPLLDAPRLPRSMYNDVVAFSKQMPATIADLKRLSYKGAALGLGAASSLISRTGDTEPDIRVFQDHTRRYLEAAALVYESAYLLIRQHRPKAVLVFNGRFACSKAIAEAARQLQQVCLFHERGATFDRFEVSDKPTHDSAHIRQCIRQSWEQALSGREEIGRAYFHRRRAGDGIGWVSFVDGQIGGSVPPRKENQRLVYFSSSDDEYAAISDLIQHRLFKSQRHAVRFLIEWVEQQSGVELVIRVHPHLQHKSGRDNEWWNSLHGVNVTLVPSSAETDSYALAESANAVLTYGSTMGVESAFLGKPVILLGDSLYSGFDCVYEPATLDELQSLLALPALKPLPPENCLPYGHYYLTFGRPYHFYQPTGLLKGTFMGVELSAEPELVRQLKRSLPGRLLRKLLTRQIRK